MGTIVGSYFYCKSVAVGSQKNQLIAVMKLTGMASLASWCECSFEENQGTENEYEREVTNTARFLSSLSSSCSVR